MQNTFFKNRRIDLLNLLPENSLVILQSSSHLTKSHDTDFPFRQDSNFKYLSGFSEPDSYIVLKKTNTVEDYLFCRSKDPFQEMWAGKRMGPEVAGETLKFLHALDVNTFLQKLSELMLGCEHVYLDIYNTKLMEKTLKTSKSLNFKGKLKEKTPASFHHLIPYLGKMRLVKDENEILAMKKAAKITSIGHQGAMAIAKVGSNEKEVCDFMEYLFKKEGAQGVAYDSIVAAGTNALTLHYINNNAPLKNNDLLLIDAGSEVNLYASDVTRTFPINGRFTSAQKEVYQLVLDAQINAINLSRPGKTLNDIHKEASRTLAQGLIDIGIYKESLDELLEKGTIREYYPHGTGHWLGLDVHDNSPYMNEGLGPIHFAPNMLFTVEPGLYFPEDDQKVPKEFRGIGIRIEDDILITENSHENLTGSIPKQIKEIEEACQKDWKEFLL